MQPSSCLRKKNFSNIQMRLESPDIMTTKKMFLGETTTKKKLTPSAICNYCQIIECSETPSALRKLSAAVIRINSPSVVPNNMSTSKPQIKQRNRRCTCGKLLLHVRIIMETTVPVQTRTSKDT